MNGDTKYQEAGWLGAVPRNWKIRRISTLYDSRNTKVSDKDYPPLSVTMNGIVPQLETAAKTQDGDNRKLVKAGDFAINSRSDRRGSCGISPYDGSVTLITNVLAPKDLSMMDPGYYSYLFKTEAFADEFYKQGTGIADDLWSTNWSRMKNIQVCVPSFYEQRRISDYLDSEVKKLESLVSSTERSIELLEEYRKSIISEAVTKGVDHDVPKKDSGLEWLSTIPAHWRVAPLWSICTFGRGTQFNKDGLVKEGFPIISYGQIHSKANLGVHLADEIVRFAPCGIEEQNKSSVVQQGDLLFAATSEDLEGLGSCACIDQDINVMAGTDTIIVRNLRSASAKYLAYLALTDAWRSQFRKGSQEVKVYHLSVGKLHDTKVVIPPEEEQTDIVTFLDIKTKIIDQLILGKVAIANRLREYQKSVIYETVTGKFKVPGIEEGE